MNNIIVDKRIIEKLYSTVSNNLRHIDGNAVGMPGYVIWEQNKNKNSLYARLAHDGYRIAWAIPKKYGTWKLIVEDEEIIKNLKL